MKFSESHPVVNLVFYICALVMGMCFWHPAFLICALFFSFVYYGIVKKTLVGYLLGMTGLFFAVALINPFFNIYGETVLFTFWKGRPYTLEAVYYGFALAAMFVSVLTWFATYHEVMTEDKFLYCFGRLAPSVSLIFTMVLRLVPNFMRKARQIAGARKCIGKSVESGTVQEKINHGMVIVSVMTSWALEDGVITADSMKSRGYGCGKRTSFSIYQMKKKDWCLLGIMTALAMMIFVCAWHGGMEISYIPTVEMAIIRQPWTMLGVFCYGALLSIPTVLYIMEEMTWYILKSKI